MLKSVVTARVALGVVLALTVAGARAQEPRVKAKEPTVVTVEGKADRVDPATAKTKPELEGSKNLFRRTVDGIGRGFAAVGHGIGRWLGATFDDKDDTIPSESERRQAEQRKQQ